MPPMEERRRKTRGTSDDDPAQGNAPWDVVRLSLVALAALVSFLGVWRPFLPFDLVAVAAAVIGGLPVYLETLEALRRRRVNMEASMALAIVASLAIQQFTAAVVITFFVLLSRYIEAYAVDRGREGVLVLLLFALGRILVISGALLSPGSSGLGAALVVLGLLLWGASGTLVVGSGWLLVGVAMLLSLIVLGVIVLLAGASVRMAMGHDKSAIVRSVRTS